MDLNKLNVGDLLKLCATLGQATGSAPCSQPVTGNTLTPVVVTTDKRGVVFGYTANPHARPQVLTDARMCLYWSADVGGVFGLADIGPTKDCKISAVLEIDAAADKRHENAEGLCPPACRGPKR
jgi:hypothetical protein